MMIVQGIKLFGFAPDEIDVGGYVFTRDVAEQCVAHSKTRRYYGFTTSTDNGSARPNYEKPDSAAFEAFNFHIDGTNLLCDITLYDQNGGQLVQWTSVERHIPIQIHLQGGISCSGGVVQMYNFTHLWLDIAPFAKALKKCEDAEAKAYMQAQTLAYEMAGKYPPPNYNKRSFEPPEWAIRAIMVAAECDPRLKSAIKKLDEALKLPNPLQ